MALFDEKTSDVLYQAARSIQLSLSDAAVIIDYDLDLLIGWGLKNGSNLMLPFILYLPPGICLCRESFCICEVLFIGKAG